MDLEALQVRSERLFNTLVVGAVALGFVVLVGLGLYGLGVMRENLQFTDLVTHTYRVQAAIADFRVLDERVETARRGYLLSHDPQFDDSVQAARGQLVAAVDKIAAATTDNPVQLANIAALRPALAQQLQAIEVSMAFARAGNTDTASFYRDQGVSATRVIRTITERMQAEEQSKLVERDRARAVTLRNLLRVAVLAGLLLALVGLGSVWVILRYTRDLTRSRAALVTLNAGLEDEVATRTADLQRANDEIQRFAYIVSHDLRSPLVNVMGFTAELEAAAKPIGVLLERAEAEAPEIVTAEARTAVRADLPESIGFIRTSTQKMDRLINAILQLSRQGRRVLTPEPVDMVRVLQGVADNLAHRASELGATVDIAPDLPGVVSDRLAVEQVFSNLVENALKYLKPGRPGRIEIRGAEQGPRVVYEVKDNGRGVDPKDHDRIFDLFRRAGAQDQPGEGIGLAHVRALAYRLGGTVACDSALDHGATFRVSLPQRLIAEGPTR